MLRGGGTAVCPDAAELGTAVTAGAVGAGVELGEDLAAAAGELMHAFWVLGRLRSGSVRT